MRSNAALSACAKAASRAFSKLMISSALPVRLSARTTRAVHARTRSSGAFSRLLMAKRFNRIQPHGGARRKIAGDQADDEKQYANDRKAVGIVSRNFDGARH